MRSSQRRLEDFLMHPRQPPRSPVGPDHTKPPTPTPPNPNLPLPPPTTTGNPPPPIPSSAAEAMTAISQGQRDLREFLMLSETNIGKRGLGKQRVAKKSWETLKKDPSTRSDLSGLIVARGYKNPPLGTSAQVSSEEMWSKEETRDKNWSWVIDALGSWVELTTFDFEEALATKMPFCFDGQSWEIVSVEDAFVRFGFGDIKLFPKRFKSLAKTIHQLADIILRTRKKTLLPVCKALEDVLRAGVENDGILLEDQSFIAAVQGMNAYEKDRKARAENHGFCVAFQKNECSGPCSKSSTGHFCLGCGRKGHGLKLCWDRPDPPRNSTRAPDRSEKNRPNPRGSGSGGRNQRRRNRSRNRTGN